MDGQGSVRRNIALKLKDNKKRREDAASPAGKAGERLKWDHKLAKVMGKPIKEPQMHICEICSLPILIYGRMKKCRHAFCRDCAKKGKGECPKCHEGEQIFEEASMGDVYVCCHGGGRYDNKGCGRSYLSLRDLEAHIMYRHKDKALLNPSPSLPAPGTAPPFNLPAAFFQTGIPLPPRGMQFCPPPPPGQLPPPPPPAIGATAAMHRPPSALAVSVSQFAAAAAAAQNNANLVTSHPQGVLPVWTRPTMFKQ